MKAKEVKEMTSEELVKKLADAGFEYNENANRFW